MGANFQMYPTTSTVFTLESGKIIIFPVAEPEFLLDDLLTKVTAENLYGEIDTGNSVGQEAW